MRTAIVTGGSRGIGAATAVALARDGVQVALTYEKNVEKAQSVVEGIIKDGGDAFSFRVDQRKKDEIVSLIDKVQEYYGDVQILVNNAGIAQEKDFERITDEDWDRIMDTNLRGPFILCQKVIPLMVKGGWGRIINISSIGGQWGGIHQVHYAIAKAGLINLTRSIAKLYGRNGITSNAVSPGLVDTDMLRELSASPDDEITRSVPMGRIASPDEIAAVVAFLAGEKASYITGQTINVNGGMYCG